METEEQELREFLSHYQLRLEFYEKMGKVFKVYTNNGLFCVKTIPATKGIAFVRHIQELFQKGYNRIVPVFATMEGRYGVIVGKQLWYLMPWLPNTPIGERAERHQQLFREMARMHTLTVKEVSVTKEEQETHYETMKERWEKQLEFLEEFVQMAERKWYMSPFELQYCTYHLDLTQAMNFSLQKLDAWAEQVVDEEKARTVMTHGKVSVQHFLYSENGYGHFINFENASEAAPHFDLLPYVVRQLRTLPQQSDETFTLIQLYWKYFPWREDEKLLFSSYLANPESCVRVVENYYHKRGGWSESEMCRKLQLQFWLLKNTEYVIMQLEEVARQEQMAAEQAQMTS